MSLRRPTLTLLVNPKAGKGRALRALPRVAERLAAALPDVTLRVELSRSMEDAVERARRAAGEARDPGDGRADALVVLGGDGMASIGLDACAQGECRLGVIPAGTGDDFARGMGLPTRTASAVEAIIEGREGLVDVMGVRGRLTPGDERRFVGSVVSTGYDAKVNHRVNHSRMRLGRFAYGWAALAELAVFEPLRYELTIDGLTRRVPAMLICVANAGYIGGGMHIAPEADVTDGLLDVTVIHPVSRATLPRLLPSVYTGGFVRDPAVERFRVQSIRVDGEHLYAMADGEDLGDVPLDLVAAPSALHLLGRSGA